MNNATFTHTHTRTYVVQRLLNSAYQMQAIMSMHTVHTYVRTYTHADWYLWPCLLCTLWPWGCTSRKMKTNNVVKIMNPAYALIQCKLPCFLIWYCTYTQITMYVLCPIFRWNKSHTQELQPQTQITRCGGRLQTMGCVCMHACHIPTGARTHCWYICTVHIGAYNE